MIGRLATATALAGWLGLVAGEGAAQDLGSIWQELIAPSADAFTSALIDASVLIEQGDPVAAIAVCDEAIELAPERADGYACLLRSLYRAGRHDVLLGRVDAIEQLRPELLTHPHIAHFPAMILAERGEYAEAARWIRGATRYRDVQASTAIHYGNLGELYAAAGDLATAVLFYRQALAADSGYLLARIGLAAALARQGDLTSARTELMSVLLDDPELAVLNTPGLFGVPEGELLLWRAMLAEVGGQAAESQRLLAAYEATPSGLASIDLVVRLREGADAGVGESTAIVVADCRPVNVALNAGGTRIAVACEGSDLREGAIRNGVAEVQRVQPLEYEGCCTWGSPIAGYVSDLAYAPDGLSLRILYSDGQAEQVPVGGSSVPRRLTQLENYEVRPVSFVGDGSRVVVVGQMSAGAFVAPWGAPLTALQLATTSTGGWVAQARATSDGRYFEASDGSSLTVFELVSGRLEQRAFIPYGTLWSYGWLAALSDDAQWVVTSRGPMLVLHRVATGRVEAFHTLGDLVENDPAAGAVSFVEATGTDRFVVGTRDRVHLFRATLQ